MKAADIKGCGGGGYSSLNDLALTAKANNMAASCIAAPALESLVEQVGVTSRVHRPVRCHWFVR